MKKYLFVSHSGILHGAEICLLESLIALKKNENCDITVLIPASSDSPLSLKINGLGIKTISNVSNPWWVDFNFRKFIFLKGTIKSIIQSFKIFNKIKPDCIVLNTIVSNPAFAIVSKILRIRTIWYIHELGDIDHKLKFFLGRKFSFEVIRFLSDQIIFNSVFTRNYFTRSFELTSVIPCAVEYNIPQIVQNSFSRDFKIFNLLIVGRTVVGKGQIDVIRCLDYLVNRILIKNIHLTILGAVGGEYLTQLKSYIAQNNLESYVEIIEFTENPVDYYAKSHIGITCSRNEAFGRVTVEYMKNGLIPIGTNTGGTKEILDEAQIRYQYVPGDYEQLGEFIKEIVNLGQDEYTKQVDEIKQYARIAYSYSNHYRQLAVAFRK